MGVGWERQLQNVLKRGAVLGDGLSSGVLMYHKKIGFLTPSAQDSCFLPRVTFTSTFELFAIYF